MCYNYNELRHTMATPQQRLKEEQFKEFIAQLPTERLISFKQTIALQLEWIEAEEQSRG